jgi:hypothetical protein
MFPSTSKFENEVISKVFKSPEVRRKEKKVCQISIFVFSVYSQKYSRMIKDLFLIYSQIWLNVVHKDNCHFFYIFLWMIAILSTNKDS